MHDYDRRPTTAAASSKTTEVEDTYWPLEVGEIISKALEEHSARVDHGDYKWRQIDEHNIEVTGKTVDGRTFKADVYVFLKRGISTRTRIVVEGTVSMGPVPPVLERVETAAKKLLETMTSLGLTRRDYLNFDNGWDNTSKQIEAWRSGDPVDPKGLRSRLNSQVKDIVNLANRLRETRPPEYGQLSGLLEEARKAFSAAARGIPDIG